MKLRPDFSINGIGQPIILLFIFAICWAIFGPSTAMWSFSVGFLFYAFLSLAYFLRTGNVWFIVTMVYQSTIASFALLAPKLGPYAISKEQFKPLLLIVILELAVLIYIMATKKLKWRGFEVLELAAKKVEDVSNGFTDRPRPLGKINGSKYEIEAFARFLKSHLIAFPVSDENKTVIMPIMMGEEYIIPLGISNDYSRKTRIEITHKGNVTALISKNDYLKYEEALAFDQLVESLGLLFMNFFDHFQKGESMRILREINKIKTSPFN